VDPTLVYKVIRLIRLSNGAEKRGEVARTLKFPPKKSQGEI
jgi:hypothetical protein